MIPIRDDIPSAGRPVVTYAIIGLNVAVFLAELAVGDPLVTRFALVPYEATTGERIDPALAERVAEFRELARRVYGPHAAADMTWQQIEGSDAFRVFLEDRYGETPEQLRGGRLSLFARLLPFLTCMFLHGGWLHLIGNMWFLHIFGDNVEDALGRGTFAAFYLFCGVVGGLAHVAASPDSPLPTVGASVAIAGVMGAYLLMYPHARMTALVPIGIFITFLEIPAAVFLVVWFLFQLVPGVASISPALEEGGVAWFAHVGGFAAGALWVWLLPKAHDHGNWVEQYRPRYPRHP